VTLVTIGEFAERTRLSAKALRLYDELGLVVPARVDPRSGYRFYAETQVEPARLVGQLRRLDMPLAVIATVLKLDGAAAAQAIDAWWQQQEATTAERRRLVSYLRTRCEGGDQHMYDINLRTTPERQLATISRHVHADQTDGFFLDAFARLRAAGSGIEGIAGVPFLVFYGEVSEDSDGPMELCRAVRPEPHPDVDNQVAGVQLRVEPAHDEVYVRLTKKELSWPEMLPACDALGQWATEHRRLLAGTFRQLLIADQRHAGPDDLVCDSPCRCADRDSRCHGAALRGVLPLQPEDAPRLAAGHTPRHRSGRSGVRWPVACSRFAGPTDGPRPRRSHGPDPDRAALDPHRPAQQRHRPFRRLVHPLHAPRRAGPQGGRGRAQCLAVP
jgi:DNA-binding transcriptional MerR regulator